MNQAWIIHKINEGFGHDSIEESPLKSMKNHYPALFQDLSDAECKMFSLPTRLAGLGIKNPTETASSSYHTSTQGH